MVLPKEVSTLEELDFDGFDMYDVQEFEGVIGAMEGLEENFDDYEGF